MIRRVLVALSLMALVSTPLGAVAATNPANADRESEPSPTPYMGWNTYYGLGGDFTEETIKSVADAMVDRGLAAAGYDIVWLDGGWQADTPRNDQGTLVANPQKFPSGLKALTDYIHSKGLRAGIYTDAGPYLPGHCGLGSHGHYQDDADQFAAWGFDAVKVDFLCGIVADLDPKTVYTEFSQALRNNSSGRELIFNLCNPVTSPDWGDYPPEQQSTHSWSYAPAIAESWRTYTDVGFQGDIKFTDVLRNFDANARHPEVAGPGQWNDPDYLGPELGMSDVEFRTQMTLWAVSAAPLVIGNDVRKLSDQTIATLTDPEVLAVDQDVDGIQASPVAGRDDLWVKPLADGRTAVAIVNRGDEAASIETSTTEIGLPEGRYVIDDAWTDTSTETTGVVRASLPAHGSAMYVLEEATGTPAQPHITVTPPTFSGVPNASGDPIIAPGGEVETTVAVHNDGSLPLRRPRFEWSTPSGWQVRAVGASVAVVDSGDAAEFTFALKVPDTAAAGNERLDVALSYVYPPNRSGSTETSASVVVPPSPPTATSSLSHHPWVYATSGWMQPTVDAAVGGESPLRIKGTQYETGIGVASPSTVRYYLGDNCSGVSGLVGLDDAVRNVGPEGATAQFVVRGDGNDLFDSGVLDRDTTASFDVGLEGIDVVDLVVKDGGDGGYNDRADWADLQVICA